MLEILGRFGGIEIEALIGNKINRLENVLTLETDLRDRFAEMYIWLEPVEVR